MDVDVGVGVQEDCVGDGDADGDGEMRETVYGGIDGGYDDEGDEVELMVTMRKNMTIIQISSISSIIVCAIDIAAILVIIV